MKYLNKFNAVNLSLQYCAKYLKYSTFCAIESLQFQTKYLRTLVSI